MSIHEMFEHQDAKILSLVPDYRINLIAPAAIPDEDFDKFSTTLREVLAFIKYSKDADKLQEVVNTDPGFRKLGRSEVDVLNNCVNANLEMKEDEEVLDMCIAIQTIADRAAEKAAVETRIIARLEDVKILMEKMNLTAEQAMDVLEIPADDRKKMAEVI